MGAVSSPSDTARSSSATVGSAPDTATDHGSLSTASLGDQPLGPLDGRYRAAVAALADHLSEAALNRERVRVEIEWLIHLGLTKAVPGVRAMTDDEISELREIVTDFDAESVAELAATERVTQHDVKAVEYYVKGKLVDTTAADLGETVHLFCTSEDVNNLAYALMVR